MKKLLRSVVAGAAMLSGTTSMALATDSVNVAFSWNGQHQTKSQK